MSSLEDAVATDQNGDQLSLENVTASPINIEEEIIEKDEKERQLAWVRKILTG